MKSEIISLECNNKQGYLPILAIFSMMLMTCSGVLGNKLISTPLGCISAASLVSPFWFILGDIITEVYGYSNSIKLYKSIIIAELLFSIFCYILIHLASPEDWQGQVGYEFVLGNLIRVTVFQFIGMSITWPLNAYLLAKWKILVNGRYFWLRSVIASGLAMTIFSMISIPLSLMGKIANHDLLTIVIVSCVLKVFFSIIFSIPSTLLVNLLERLENQQLHYVATSR